MGHPETCTVEPDPKIMRIQPHIFALLSKMEAPLRRMLIANVKRRPGFTSFDDHFKYHRSKLEGLRRKGVLSENDIRLIFPPDGSQTDIERFHFDLLKVVLQETCLLNKKEQQLVNFQTPKSLARATRTALQMLEREFGDKFGSKMDEVKYGDDRDRAKTVSTTGQATDVSKEDSSPEPTTTQPTDVEKVRATEGTSITEKRQGIIGKTKGLRRNSDEENPPPKKHKRLETTHGDQSKDETSDFSAQSSSSPISPKASNLAAQLEMCILKNGTQANETKKLTRAICKVMKAENQPCLGCWTAYFKTLPGFPVFVVEVSDKQMEDLRKKKQPPEIGPFRIIFRCPNDANGELTTCVTKTLETSIAEEEKLKIKKIIKAAWPKLKERHSNLAGMRRSHVKCRGFKDGNPTYDQIPCIALLVPFKGLIPFWEKEFPKMINGVPTDVYEGNNFPLYQPAAHQQFTNLRMGSVFEAEIKTLGQTEPGIRKQGSIGPFLEYKKDGINKIGFLSCAHVAFKYENNIPPNTEMDRNAEICCYQKDEHLFGKVRDFKCNWANGVDAALVEITDRNRIPQNGEFPDSTDSFEMYDKPLEFADGTIVDNPPISTANDPELYVVKYGAQTGLTLGDIIDHDAQINHVVQDHSCEDDDSDTLNLEAGPSSPSGSIDPEDMEIDLSDDQEEDPGHNFIEVRHERIAFADVGDSGGLALLVREKTSTAEEMETGVSPKPVTRLGVKRRRIERNMDPKMTVSALGIVVGTSGRAGSVYIMSIRKALDVLNIQSVKKLKQFTDGSSNSIPKRKVT